jgi:hypothetical protein
MNEYACAATLISAAILQLAHGARCRIEASQLSSGMLQ